MSSYSIRRLPPAPFDIYYSILKFLNEYLREYERLLPPDLISNTPVGGDPKTP